MAARAQGGAPESLTCSTAVFAPCTSQVYLFQDNKRRGLCAGVEDKATACDTGILHGCQFLPRLLRFPSSSLLMARGKQQQVAKCWGPVSHVGDRRKRLALAWPNPACCDPRE